MTTNHTTSPAEPLSTIPRDEMVQYIANGRAEQWTYPIEDLIPEVSLLDGAWEQNSDGTWVLQSGTWYVVWEDSVDEDVYEVAPTELASVLSDVLPRLRTAHDQVASVDTQHIAHGEGDVPPLPPERPEP